MKVIAIGGVALSMSAMAKFRRMNKNADLVVYEQGEVLSYGACGMPYYISDEIKDATKLVARTKKQFEDRGITVHTNHRVIKVDEIKKVITVKNLATNETFQDSFDKLIIGSGAKPIIPPWDGVTLNRIFTLSKYEDSIMIKSTLDNNPSIKQVVVVGGGFIGTEMIDAFLTRKLDVRLIQLDPQILMPFDADMVKPLEEHLVQKGVSVHLNESVESFSGEEVVTQVHTNKGTYNADLVIIAIGIKPNTSFIENTTIKRADNGGIITNEFMQTNHPDIYAGGDCSVIYDQIYKEPKYYPMGSHANKQGRIIAKHLAGKEEVFPGVLGTIVIKVVGMNAAKTGVTMKGASELGYDVDHVTITGNNHAGYYPNPQKITVRIVYEKNTHVMLGAQLVGKEGTVLRINPFVVAISNGLTTEEFSQMDFAYAPPFSGVWDIIAVAANQVK